jgi:hypothetical protein
MVCGTDCALNKYTFTEELPMTTIAQALENAIDRLATLKIGKHFFAPREAHLQQSDIYARLDLEAKPERRLSPIAARHQYNLYGHTARMA